nr:unnamed protein product [Naegleria fowleri]
MPQLDILKETAKSDLCDVLDSVPGDKALILDDQIIGPLGIIAPSNLLKEHGVKKVHKLADQPFDTPLKSVMYIVRPRMHLMKWIANQIKYWITHRQSRERESMQKSTKSDKKSKDKNANVEKEQEVIEPPTNFSIFLVPRTTLICEKILKDCGVFGDVKIGEYALDLIVFDPHILSMEISTSFKECELDGDFSSLYYVARSIMKLQSYYGLIPNVKYIGSSANHVFDMIMRMKKQVGSQVFSVVPEINTLILIDRGIDLITPMLTQLTYEGLIDEILGGISNSLFLTDCSPESRGTPKKVLLNSYDTVFDRVRHLNQQHVASRLQEKAREIDEKMKEREELKQSIEKIKAFTKLLPQLQEDKRNLEMHINIMQQIRTIIGKMPFRKLIQTQNAILTGEDDKATMEYIDESIDRQNTFVQVLRVLCLYSLVNGGFKAKVFEKLRREIVQSFGLQALVTLNNLEKVGLLKKQDTKTSNWSYLKKNLSLYDDNVMERTDEDAIYDPHVVYNGYCPITVAVVEQAMNEDKGWRKIEPVLNNISQKHGEETQKGSQDSQLGKKVVLVYFIGGVTFAEISAITYLNERSNDCEYIVATTKLINGSTFLETLIEDVGEGNFSFKRKATHGVGLLSDAPKPQESTPSASSSQSGGNK